MLSNLRDCRAGSDGQVGHGLAWLCTLGAMNGNRKDEDNSANDCHIEQRTLTNLACCNL
jgi:hypothetical protein